MYYIDCGCEHDIFKEFRDEIEATEYYNKLECKDKILYMEVNGGFKTLEKSMR